MNGVPFPIGPCVVALVVTAAVWDWNTRRIPNWLVGAALIVALPVQWMLHGALGGVQTWLLGCLAGGLFFLPGYLLRAVGAGDVKLTAAIGAFCGAACVFQIALVACVIGAVWALVSLIQRRRARAGLTNALSMLFVMAGGFREAARHGQNFREQSAGRLPYGVVIAISTVGVLLTSA
ncbi:A24 family peptidase [Paraburkholderia sp. GAS334]|jgi:prepilin peptidase CpaA|uniref:A24 family peptidase n=1 Tax=unclassified Paraburkholderia TaxID=2615204 RepID=UPI003D1A4E57